MGNKVDKIMKNILELESPQDIMAVNRCVKKATASIRREKQAKVFLCFNIRKGKIINQTVAMEYCRFVKDRGYLPIAPYLMFKGVFDTQINEERDELDTMAQGYLEQCSEMWVVGGEITRVMAKQIEQAEKNNVCIRYFDEFMEEI